MDVPIPKKHPLIRYKYYILSGAAFLALMVYVLIVSIGPQKLRINEDNIQIVTVTKDKFMEYVDIEGLVKPILTIKVNTREMGNVLRIVAEEGTLLEKGDTILLLDNPDLLRTIEDQQDEWEKQLITYQEQEIEMEQNSLTLKQQILQAVFELSQLEKVFNRDKSEYKMGAQTKAQLEVSENEYNYNLQKTQLQMESLRHDSTMALFRKELLKGDKEREQKKYNRAVARLQDLAVRAPIAGQLSFVNATPGQRVNSGEAIAEIKVLDQFKISTQLSEYYIDRITTGLPATATAPGEKGEKFPLRISKVVPEVKDRTFDVDLVFTGKIPENIRIGQTFRIQIELGQAEEAIVIPRGNFYQSTGGQWIYKLNESGNKAQKVPVSIGRQNPVQYEITEGLQPGDKVIITGYDNFGEVDELVL